MLASFPAPTRGSQKQLFYGGRRERIRGTVYIEQRGRGKETQWNTVSHCNRVFPDLKIISKKPKILFFLQYINLPLGKS